MFIPGVVKMLLVPSIAIAFGSLQLEHNCVPPLGILYAYVLRLTSPYGLFLLFGGLPYLTLGSLECYKILWIFILEAYCGCCMFARNPVHIPISTDINPNSAYLTKSTKFQYTQRNLRTISNSLTYLEQGQ